MGRRKIVIRPITDARLRHVTFNKRKNGLIKKAAELSMLCDLKLLLIFEDTTGALVQYSAHDIFNQFEYFTNFMEDENTKFSPRDYPNFFKVNHYKKNSKTSIKQEEKQQKSSEKTKKQLKQAMTIPKPNEESSTDDSFFIDDAFASFENNADYTSLNSKKNSSQSFVESSFSQAPSNQRTDLNRKGPRKNLSLNVENQCFLNLNNLQSLKSPEVPYLSPSFTNNPQNQFQWQTTKTQFVIPITSAQRKSQLLNQQVNQEANSQTNAQKGMKEFNTNFNMVQANTPNPMSVNTGPFGKFQSFFDQLDSPFTKSNFNQKLFPAMGFNLGGEEGFSPFMKNMALNINTKSAMGKEEDVFTFKNDARTENQDHLGANNWEKQDFFEDEMRRKKKLKVA
jgi:hypothetical protein